MSKQNTNQILTMIQNLPVDEQSNLINAMRMLEVNAQDEQYFTNVTKAMQAAGWNPVKRAAAGVKAAMRNRMEATKGINSRKTARMMRLFGMRKTADFMDRWLTSAPKKKFKEIKTPSKTGIETGQTKSVESILVVKKQLNYITTKVDDIGDDVTDIKSLLMPRFVTAKGKAGTPDAGGNEVSMFNPLAPVGKQFMKVDDRTGTLKGKTGKNFKSSAEEKAALETAKLALKIQKKDEEKAALKKKYEYKDEAEVFKEESPVEELRKHLDERLDTIEKKIGEKGGGLFEMIAASLGGLLTKITDFLSPITDTIKSMFGELKKVGLWLLRFGRWMTGTVWRTIRTIWNSVRLLKWLATPAGVAAMLAGAVTAGIAMWFDKGMKEGADKAHDKVLTDVTRKIARQEKEWKTPYSKDQKYLMYKQDMDLAYNAQTDPTKKAYMKQRFLTSPNLSEEEKEMARRYFEEKEGNVAEYLEELSDEGNDNFMDVFGEETPATAPPSSPAVGDTGTLTTPEFSKSRDIPPEGRAFLDALSIPESGGRYNAIVGDGQYGGPASVTDFSKHPHAPGVGLKGGKWTHLNDPEKDDWSTAAGKYQITGSTWDRISSQYGIRDFSPESQDLAAWNLAKDDYKRNTGRDLLTDLRTKDFNNITKGLNKTWTSLAGGSEEQGRGSAEGTRTRYEDFLTKQGVTPAPALAASTTDGLSRQHQAFNSPASTGVFGLPPIINNTTQISNSTVARRPAMKADVLSQDNSFIRALSQDVQHPIFG